MRHLLPRLSVVLFALFLLGMVDIALYLIFDAREETLRTLPGQQHEVIGKLARSVENINALPRSDDTAVDAKRVELLNTKVLAQLADVPGLSIRFLELRGRVWRGMLTVDAETPAGNHEVSVFPKENLEPQGAAEEPSVVGVAVFATPEAMRHSYTSFSERYFGFGPWWVVTGILPIAALLLLHTFREGVKSEARLQADGIGPIYKLARGKDHWDLLFGLGSNHGVQEGESLQLLDAKHRPVGTVTALRVRRDSTEARLALDADISPFYVVAKTSSQEKHS